MKSGLNETQIRLLKEGAWSLSSSLMTYYKKKNIHLWMENKKAISIFIGIGILISGCSSPTIQKKINVTESLRSGERFPGGMWVSNLDSKDNVKEMSRACLKISISEKTLDELLEKGTRVITSTKWSQPVEFTYSLDGYGIKSQKKGTCFGLTYILEGPKAVLDKI